MKAWRANPSLQRALWLITQLFVEWIAMGTMADNAEARARELRAAPNGVNDFTTSRGWKVYWPNVYILYMPEPEVHCEGGKKKNRQRVLPANAIWLMDLCQGRMTRVQYCRLAKVIKILTASKQENDGCQMSRWPQCDTSLCKRMDADAVSELLFLPP